MKQLLKRILLILLAVLIAVQAPFIYRRYKIGKLAEKIEELNRNRPIPAPDPKFKEYKGIIHAHTNLGGHSTGSFEELIAAANANDLDFVIMTEHWSDTMDTAALTLNGVYGKTLFIGGNEIDTADGDRFLMIPGSADAASLRKMSTAAVLEKLHTENRLALVTYPEKFRSWDSQFDGIEVFSLHTNAKKMNPFTALFDGIWSFPAYPELTLATYFKRPVENLRKFDEISTQRNVSLVAGTDAHSNIGFHLFGDDAGNKGLNIKIDDYAKIFRLARVHVLIENDKPLDRESLTESIRTGQYFVGFDVLGDSTGFRFRIEGSGKIASMGDSIENSADLQIAVSAPLGARKEIFRNGEFIGALAPNESYLDIVKIGSGSIRPGTYRVEVIFNDLGPPFDKMPWIISNPIYVE